MICKRMTALALMLLVIMMCVGCHAQTESEGEATATTDTTTTVAQTTTAVTNELITAETKIGTIDASSLIVRDGPGLDYEGIGGVQEGETIVIVDRVDDWYKIEFGDDFAYINSQYVNVVGQTTYTTGTIVTTTTTTTTVTTTAPTATVTDEHGNVVTTVATTGPNGETAASNVTTTTSAVQTDNTEIDFESIPGVEVVDQW